jgi:hypothetical protein
MVNLYYVLYQVFHEHLIFWQARAVILFLLSYIPLDMLGYIDILANFRPSPCCSKNNVGTRRMNLIIMNFVNMILIYSAVQ